MDMIVRSYEIEEGDFTLELPTSATAIKVGFVALHKRPRILIYQDAGYRPNTNIAPRRYKSVEVNGQSVDMASNSPSTTFRVIGSYDYDDRTYVLFEECRFSEAFVGSAAIPTMSSMPEIVESDEQLHRSTL